jgi:hypothetical protein
MFGILRHGPFRAAIVEDYRREARPAEALRGSHLRGQGPKNGSASLASLRRRGRIPSP